MYLECIKSLLFKGVLKVLFKGVFKGVKTSSFKNLSNQNIEPNWLFSFTLVCVYRIPIPTVENIY